MKGGYFAPLMIHLHQGDTLILKEINYPSIINTSRKGGHEAPKLGIEGPFEHQSPVL